MEKETAGAEAINQQEEDTSQNDSSQTVEDQTIEDNGEVHDEKKEGEEEKSPYEQQIEELEKKHQDELKRKDDIIAKKNRAIEASKKKKAEKAEESNEAEGDEDLRAEVQSLRATLDERLTKLDVRKEVEALTNDPAEQKAILLHYDQTIQKSGDTAKDVRNAWAIANQHIVAKSRQAQEDLDLAEDIVVRSSMSSQRGRKDRVSLSPEKREAAKLLDQWGLKDAKKLL